MRAISWVGLLLLLMGFSPFPEMSKFSSALKGIQPAHIRATVGGSATLSCSFAYIGHMNDTRLGKFFTQNDHSRMSNAVDVKCRPRVSKKAHLHCNFSSTIINVRPEDETTYYCEVFIPRADGTVKVTGTGTAVTLYSEVSSIGIQPAPQLASGSESVLTCEATGFYPRNASVRWFRGETPVLPSDVTDVITRARNGTFSLRSRYRFQADALDHGARCRCLVSHPSWTRGGSASVTLDVGYGPRLLNVTSHSGLVTQSCHLSVGSSLSISCSADGNPSPEMQWQGGSVKARDFGGILQLAALQEEDGGTYWCVAKNMYGEKNASITLLVSQSKLLPSLRLAVLCVLGAVLMILVITIVCHLTKRMNRSQARTLSDFSSECAFSHEIQGASPAIDELYSVLEVSNKRTQQHESVFQAVDESQLIYTVINFPLTSRNENVMEAPEAPIETTECPIYSMVMLKDGGGHHGGRRNGLQKP